MDTVGDIFLVVGASWSLLAAIGIVRFEDVFFRMHAGTKATTLGVALIVLGAALKFNATVAAKLVLVVVLAYLTIPVGAHLVGRAVYHHRGDAHIQIDTIDELAEADL